MPRSSGRAFAIGSVLTVIVTVACAPAPARSPRWPPKATTTASSARRPRARGASLPGRPCAFVRHLLSSSIVTIVRVPTVSVSRLGARRAAGVGLLLSLDQAVDVRAQVRELRQLLRRDLVARVRQRDRDDLLHLGRRVRQHDDAVGQVDRLVDVVRDEQDRDPELVAHPQHEVLEVAAGLRVDRGERLVHQQDRRLVGERARDRDALLHAARELPRDSGR